MKILIVGTGSIGTAFGALFLEHNQNVTFLARSNYNLFKEKELITHGVLKESSYKLNIFNNTNDLEKFDLIILSVKSYDIESSAKSIINCIKDNTIVLTIQNGVENEEKIIDFFPDNLLGGLTYLDSELHKNVIEVSTLNRTVIGELNSENKDSDRLHFLINFMNECGIPTEKSEDLKRDKWIKIVWNSAFNSLSTIERKTPRELLENMDYRNQLVRLMSEALRVGKREGIRFPDNLISRYLKTSFDLYTKTSMLQDFENNKKLEYESLCGYIVRIAEEKHKFKVPETKKIYEQLKEISKQ